MGKLALEAMGIASLYVMSAPILFPPKKQ